MQRWLALLISGGLPAAALAQTPLIPLQPVPVATPAPRPVMAAPAPKGLAGTFYVSVDDKVKLFVNGQKVHEGKLWESQSPEVEISYGQRIVAQLENTGDKHRFMLAFVSTDKKTVISFRHTDFKIVPDFDVTDFTVAQLRSWPKYSVLEKHARVFPFGSYSEWVWGGTEKCVLAAVITPEMVRPMPSQ